MTLKQPKHLDQSKMSPALRQRIEEAKQARRECQREQEATLVAMRATAKAGRA